MKRLLTIAIIVCIPVVAAAGMAVDITQDVFLAACRLLPHESGDLRLEPWLYRVTVTTAPAPAGNASGDGGDGSGPGGGMGQFD